MERENYHMGMKVAINVMFSTHPGTPDIASKPQESGREAERASPPQSSEGTDSGNTLV